MGLLFAAKYPFSVEARQVLSGHELSDEYDLVESAFNQTVSWLKHNDPHSELKQMQAMKPSELEAKIICFPLSKILCGLAGRKLVSMLASSFMKRTHYFLVNSPEDTAKLMRELFGSEDNIHVSQFLANKPHGVSLAQVGLSKGIVKVPASLAPILVSESVARSILSFIPPSNPGKNFKFFANELKKEGYQEEQVTGPVSFPAFPPCIKQIIQELESGEKVGHMPRFVLATFLSNIGLTKKEIVKFYEKQPNFDRKKTEYHVSTLMGEGGGTRYTVPSCETIRSYGLCRKDESCKWNHPLTYYRRTRKRKV